MPKSNLIAAVEKISERIAKKILRDCKAFATIGTWIKTLEDENRILKQRINLVEIRIKKLNAYGPTPLTNKEADIDRKRQEENQTRLTPGQLKKFRIGRKLTQGAMAALLEVKVPKYARWEKGQSIMTSEVESLILELKQLKAKELRSKLQHLGFYQATGKKTKTVNRQKVSPASKAKKMITEPLITNVQIRELRLKLSYTHSQMAALYNVKPKTYSNWEYNACRPPKDVAKKLQFIYAESFSHPLYNSKKTKEKIHVKQNYGLPIVSSSEMQEIRKTYGLTRKQMAQVIGVRISQYQNWEDRNRQVPPLYAAHVRELANQDATGRAEHIKAAGIEKATGRFDQKKKENK